MMVEVKVHETRTVPEQWKTRHKTVDLSFMTTNHPYQQLGPSMQH